MELIEESRYRFRIPRQGQMRVPGIVYASRELIPELAADRPLQHVANVATLPGIVTASYAMPDVHRGHGFPIGGVAATDPAVKAAAGSISSCHGAGRVMSRHQALLTVRGAQLQRRLEAAGIAARGISARGLAEEPPKPAKT